MTVHQDPKMCYHYHIDMSQLKLLSKAQHKVIDLLSDVSEHEIPSFLWTGHITQLITDSKWLTS